MLIEPHHRPWRETSVATSATIKNTDEAPGSGLHPCHQKAKTCCQRLLETLRFIHIKEKQTMEPIGMKGDWP